MVNPKIETKRKFLWRLRQDSFAVCLNGCSHPHLLRFAHTEHVFLVIDRPLLLCRQVRIVHIDWTALGDISRLFDVCHVYDSAQPDKASQKAQLRITKKTPQRRWDTIVSA